MTLLLAAQYWAIAPDNWLPGLYTCYVILAIPLFISAADLTNRGGIRDRLLGFCRILGGRFRGGLGHVNVVASLIFSGMSGSAIADAVGMGRIVIKMMTRDGKYTPGYAAAITAASATIGPIVPPSIPLVLYALVSDASIGYLFLGGAVPGLIMGIVLMSMNSIMARLRKFPVEESLPTKEAVNTTFRALPALFMPVVLLVGIYGGVMTPTEAAAVAAAYAFFISVVFYRSISFKEAYMAVSSSAQSTVSVGILISGALVFNYVVTIENIPLTLSQIFSQFNFNAVEFLIAVNIVLLILGCLLEAGTILLVIIPMFLPTAQVLGIDLVHFGVVVVVNVMIGLITPPYGLLLFIVANITGLPLKTVIREIFPFLIVLICALLIITLVPDIVLWLPRQFGYKL
jgi:tripartite ATP-independent transporter DctM subunit